MKLAALTLLCLMILLFSSSISRLPKVEAASPPPLKAFSGTLTPGSPQNSTELTWQLQQGVSEFIFHYKVSGGSTPNDQAFVSIEGHPELAWPAGSGSGLKGEGWNYCQCPLTADTYTVLVETNATAPATAPVSFNFGFYSVPRPPVEFGGQVSADYDVRTSDFGVLFPGGNNTLVLDTTSGGYEFSSTDVSTGKLEFSQSLNRTLDVNVTSNMELTTNFTRGFHLLQVTAADGQAVGWSVRVQGQPELVVTILMQCTTVDLNSTKPLCVAGANATASDGSQANATYLWTDNGGGGSFNSTIGRWVAWAPPGAVGTYTLTVKASAPGYLSGTANLDPIKVIPEFPSTPIALLVAFLIAVALCQGRRRHSLT
jgi:hypothetical protein